MSNKFPKGFLWGTATSAHQVEGNNVYSDTWLMEHLPGSLFAEPSGDGCDHYHRYPQHIAMLAELGFNAYRFSVEWARVEPEEGYFSLAILEHYRHMLATCHEHGLTPFITFHHFTSPRWLMASGGWESEDTPGKFARFCERVTQHLGDLVGGACTLNEPNVGALITSMGYLPPAKQMQQAPWWQAAAKMLGTTPEKFAPYMFAVSEHARDIMLAAHRMAYNAIKSSRADFPVGITLALQAIQAGEGGEAYANKMRHRLNDYFLEAVRGDDFVGVQAYSRLRLGPQGPLPPEPGVELTQMGYEFWPEALETVIREAHAVAGIPVVVTENGIATEDDSRRQEYIRRALHGVANCLNDGIDVRGYFYWSAFDNYEWTMGYRPRFGLISVDRKTLEPTAKPSARWLGQVARANALPANE